MPSLKSIIVVMSVCFFGSCSGCLCQLDQPEAEQLEKVEKIEKIEKIDKVDKMKPSDLESAPTDQGEEKDNG